MLNLQEIIGIKENPKIVLDADVCIGLKNEKKCLTEHHFRNFSLFSTIQLSCKRAHPMYIISSDSETQLGIQG